MGQPTVKPMDIKQAGSGMTHPSPLVDREGALAHLSLQQVIDLVVFYEVEARLRGVTLDDCDLVAQVATTVRVDEECHLEDLNVTHEHNPGAVRS